MQKTKFFKYISLILCVVLVAALALFATGCRNKNDISQPATTETVLGNGETSFNFSVVDSNGKETKFVINTDKETVCDALIELNLIDGDMGPFGLYVKTVNGITLDYDKDGKYWAFYIDGEYASSGVESTEITQGVTYSLKAQK